MKAYALAIGILASVCHAADSVEISGTAAYLKPFLDESGGLVAGATVRIPLMRRLSVRPELFAGTITGYRHVVGLGSVLFDVTSS